MVPTPWYKGRGASDRGTRRTRPRRIWEWGGGMALEDAGCSRPMSLALAPALGQRFATVSGTPLRARAFGWSKAALRSPDWSKNKRRRQSWCRSSRPRCKLLRSLTRDKMPQGHPGNARVQRLQVNSCGQRSSPSGQPEEYEMVLTSFLVMMKSICTRFGLRSAAPSLKGTT